MKKIALFSILIIQTLLIKGNALACEEGENDLKTLLDQTEGDESDTIDINKSCLRNLIQKIMLLERNNLDANNPNPTYPDSFSTRFNNIDYGMEPINSNILRNVKNVNFSSYVLGTQGR